MISYAPTLRTPPLPRKLEVGVDRVECLLYCLRIMKKLLLFICFGLMTACDSSDREQKLADEVLELKTTQIQQEAEQKIAKIHDDFTAQLEELNVQHQKENADAASIINNLREENQTLKLQLAASIKDHGGDAEGGAHGEPTAADDPSKKDESKGAISIVGEGESIVVNPANSNGTRYLLVDIVELQH